MVVGPQPNNDTRGKTLHPSKLERQHREHKRKKRSGFVHAETVLRVVASERAGQCGTARNVARGVSIRNLLVWGGTLDSVMDPELACKCLEPLDGALPGDDLVALFERPVL